MLLRDAILWAVCQAVQHSKLSNKCSQCLNANQPIILYEVLSLHQSIVLPCSLVSLLSLKTNPALLQLKPSGCVYHFLEWQLTGGPQDRCKRDCDSQKRSVCLSGKLQLIIHCISTATGCLFYKSTTRKRQMQWELLIIQPCLTQTVYGSFQSLFSPSELTCSHYSTL